MGRWGVWGRLEFLSRVEWRTGIAERGVGDGKGAGITRGVRGELERGVERRRNGAREAAGKTGKADDFSGGEGARAGDGRSGAPGLGDVFRGNAGRCPGCLRPKSEALCTKDAGRTT